MIPGEIDYLMVPKHEFLNLTAELATLEERDASQVLAISRLEDVIGERDEVIDTLVVQLAAAEDLVKELEDALSDKADLVSKAMGKAWQLGQTYWQQADSESWSENKKSDATYAKFQTLVEETRAAIERSK